MLAYEKKQSLYLPSEHLRGIFNLAGIVMPAVMLDGVVCGRWRRKANKLDIFGFRSFSELEKRDMRKSAEVLFGRDLSHISFQ